MNLRKKILGKQIANVLNKKKDLSQIKVNAAVAIIIATFALTAQACIKYPEVVKSFEKKSNNEAVITVKLDKNNPNAVAALENHSEIVPGESSVQKNEREKAEALALAKKKQRAEVITRERRVYSDPQDFNQVYLAAEARFGVPSQLLRAIHYVETGCSGSTSKASYAGATGPMQFLPSTFRRHAVDGNGDGYTDITNLEDAVFTAAAYLKACGYPDIKRAIYGYNRSDSYFRKVMMVANTFGYSG